MRGWLFRMALCLVLLAANHSAVFAAQELKSLGRGSYQQLVAARAGKPFIVVFWSVSCTYCGAELAMFGKLLKKHRDLDLVVVSTDTPADERQITAILNKYSLDHAEAWVFADSYSDRLRFEVDREWYGELPRTYFFTSEAGTKAFSGKLDQAEVERWIKQQHLR